MYYRASKKYSKDVSLYDPIGTDKEGNKITLVDVVESGDISISDQVQVSQQIQAMLQAIEMVLSEKEKIVVQMRYGLLDGKEHTQKEIAVLLHISRSYVSRIEKSALEKLREKLE